MNDPGWWWRMEQEYSEREERLDEARAKIKELDERLKREAEASRSATPSVSA